MTERMLLVDYENVQAVALDQLPSDVHVLLVLGMKQSKLPTELALQAQALGGRFKYVPIRGQAANAVDFCIAFLLGEQLTQHPTAECVILSKDKKGFDPLVKYLVSERGLKVRRVNSQKEAFPEKPKTADGKAKASAVVSEDPFERVLKLLKKEQSRPLKRAGLEGKVKSYHPTMPVAGRRTLVERLFRDGKVVEAGGKLTYHL